MSCISKILETKGDKEFIIDGTIAIEGGGIYKGYEYIITFVDIGHRCGYVAISENHPLYGSHNQDDDFDDIEVHGGVTFFGEPRFEKFTYGHICTDKWIGFDAAHYNDSSDIETAEKYFGETKYVKYRKMNPIPEIYSGAEYRSYSYMENQCKLMIDQLIGMEI